MNSATSRKPDREPLLAVVGALEVPKANLRRDPCGDWNIIGRRGHISTDGSGHMSTCGTKRRWEKAKRALSFLTVTQNGDVSVISMCRKIRLTRIIPRRIFRTDSIACPHRFCRATASHSFAKSAQVRHAHLTH